MFRLLFLLLWARSYFKRERGFFALRTYSHIVVENGTAHRASKPIDRVEVILPGFSELCEGGEITLITTGRASRHAGTPLDIF